MPLWVEIVEFLHGSETVVSAWMGWWCRGSTGEVGYKVGSLELPKSIDSSPGRCGIGKSKRDEAQRLHQKRKRLEKKKVNKQLSFDCESTTIEKKNRRFDMSSSVVACSFARCGWCANFFLLSFLLSFFHCSLFSFFFLQRIKPLDPLTFSVGNQVLDREIHVLLCHCYKRQGHTAFSLGDPGLRRRHHDIQNLSFVNMKRYTICQYKLSLQRLHSCPMLASCMS